MSAVLPDAAWQPAGFLWQPRICNSWAAPSETKLWSRGHGAVRISSWSQPRALDAGGCFGRTERRKHCKRHTFYSSWVKDWKCVLFFRLLIFLNCQQRWLILFYLIIIFLWQASGLSLSVIASVFYFHPFEINLEYFARLNVITYPANRRCQMGQPGFCHT